MKKISNIFSKIILIVLIIILIYILYSKYIVKEKVTKIFGYGFLVVLTGSMEPEITPGELIIIKENNDYNLNDIITYETEELVITHRIIEKSGEYYICKGDSNNEKDLKILADQIEGKVIYHSKILRRICKSIFKIYINYICCFISNNILDY